jgi:phage terminase large subunit
VTTAQIAIVPKLIPVFAGEADVRGAHGGRGSGKTRSFAKMTAVRAYAFAKEGIEGVVLCGRQYQNSLADSSFAEVKAAIAEEPWLAAHFDLGETYIKTKDGRVRYVFAGLDRNIDSIKTTARILLAWVDEAESVTESAWQILIPTLREEGEHWHAELWVTWNPKRKGSATDKRFRQQATARMKIVEVNWRDNPRFPSKLDRERREDMEMRPGSYPHVWEGDYLRVVEGAYFASYILKAREEGRIGIVPADPIMRKRAFVDIGGTGAKADAFAIWIAQFVGLQIRVLDYYEAVGQPVSAHLQWLANRGHTSKTTDIWLPHDGDTQDKVYDVSYASALREAGYTVTVVPNQGKGAAMARIQEARRLWPSIWIHEPTCGPGLEALAWYQEKRDDERGIGLGPMHDWSSHGCFHGDTEVLTRYGTYRIMDLPVTGEVLTPCGWKQYIAPRITKKAARLVEVRFVGGYSVKCTPDHLFMTELGWKSAESLQMGTLIRSSLTGSRSISEVPCIEFGQAIGITRRAGAAFIETFGGPRSGRYRLGATFTIGTATRQTIDWQTSNALMRRSICASSAMKTQFMAKVRSGHLLAKRLLSGTALPMAVSGTSGMPNVPKAGPSGSESRKTAFTARSSSALLSAKAAILRCIAALPAKWRPIESAENRTNGLLLIESVNPLAEVADVWDITVPDGHWFSLENGAVVHNSDAFGLMCVAHEPPTATWGAPINYPGLGRIA